MNTKTMKSVFCAVAAALASLAHAGTTYYVNGTGGNDGNAGTSGAPFKTIGKALTVARDTDRIEVAPATYKITGTLYVTNAVELVGMGTTRTDVTVSAQQDTGTRPLVVSNALAKVANIKFSGGYGRWNTGHYPANCAWIYAGTATNCVFADSWMCNGAYGGVCVQTEDAYIVDCEICGHRNVDGNSTYAAGLSLVNGTARRCHIHDNPARQGTGGVVLSGAKAQLLDSVVENNGAWSANDPRGINKSGWAGSTDSAGGVSIRNANAVVSNCVISSNRAYLPTDGSPGWNRDNYGSAGGLRFAAAAKVYNTVIRGNRAYNWGGGVYGSGSLYNCVIADNVAEQKTGAGVYGGSTLYNCTVTGNVAANGSGVDGSSGSRKATVENGIVYANGATDTGANVTLTATFTDNPKFVDAAVGDYRLDIGSPCIDTASAPSVTLPATDAAGNPRVANGQIDYGAYEAAPFFRVVGDPETFGVPATPAFGEHADLAFGTVNASVTSPYADATGLTNTVCTGYTYVAQGNDNVVTTNEGAGASYAAPYARFGILTWHLESQYKQTVVMRGNGTGTVTGAGLVAKDAEFTLTATPDAGDHFWRWEGDIGDNDPTSPTITLTADFARTVTAIFGRDWYVATTGNDTTGDGTSAAPFKTIHKGLSVAGNGDRVLVAAGTYGFDLTHQALVLTNAVELVGTGAKRTDVTVYYGSSTEGWSGVGGKRLLYMNNKLAKVSHLDLVGPKNAYNRPGSIDGSQAYVSAGTVSDCVLRDSYVDGAAGCGVYLDTADAVVEDSLLLNHFSVNYYAGGVALTINNGVARRCEITGNISRQNGPVGLKGATARLFDSAVTNNQSCASNPMWKSTVWGGGYGPGVLIKNAGAIVSNCVIAANRANLPSIGSPSYCKGGGIVFQANAKVYNTVIEDNYSYLEGGGVYVVSGYNGYLYNCVIAGNASENGSGGGVRGFAYLYNCTVTGNESQLDGGVDGIDGLDATKKAVVQNSIVWANGATDLGANVTVTSAYTADPKFVNAAAGDYTLDFGSPCIDTAASAAAAGLPATDAAGYPRVANGALDYGAYEAPTLLRVVSEPTGIVVPATPSFGEHADLEPGMTAFSVTSPYPYAGSDSTNLVCTGYTYVTQDGDNVVATNRGETSSFSADYSRMALLTWSFGFSYVQSPAVAGTGTGTVTGGGSYAAGEPFTLTATPDAGCVFSHWEGDIGNADPVSATITLDSDRARAVTAVFGHAWYVATTGNDDNDGRTPATAKKTPSKVVPLAGDGDIVYFAAGTYALPASGVKFVYTTLTLTNSVRLVGQGANRAAVTVQSTDWVEVGRPLWMANRYARVENMTFWGIDQRYGNPSAAGKNPYGQCALIDAGLATNCVFSGSTLGGAYAGVVLETADAVAVDCEISNHYTVNQYDHGGGLAIVNGLALNCVIKDNVQRSNTGGVSLNGAQARLIGCVVTNNASHGYTDRAANPGNTWGGTHTAGGVYVLNKGAVISNCVIACNANELPIYNIRTTNNFYRAGGILFAAAGKVYDTVIHGNRSYSTGGAVACRETGYVPELYNCLIYGNSCSNMTGGAVSGTVKLFNCTVTENWTDFAGGVGGVDSGATLLNGILWNNWNRSGATPVLSNYGTATMTYSCTSPLAAGEGNIDSDPQLKRSRIRGMYCIGSTSPCAKAGQWQSWMPGLKYLNGVDMPATEGAVPMGCYAPYKDKGLVVVFW